MMLSSFRTTAASLARRKSHERAQNTIGARVAAHRRPCYTSANSTAPVRLGFHAEKGEADETVPRVVRPRRAARARSRLRSRQARGAYRRRLGGLRPHPALHGREAGLLGEV